MKKLIHITLLGCSTLLFVQCAKFTSTSKDVAPSLPANSYSYAVAMPATVVDNTPENNKISNDGATLGRVLFYDKKLSVNNAVACASCHNQKNAFADPIEKSVGFDGAHTSRNSMSIVNAANETSYFWDGRTDGLEQMVLQPVRHQVEMGIEKMDILPAKLAKVDYYKPLFENAFGTPEVTKERIAMAMAQFIRSMSVYNSLADEAGVSTAWGSDFSDKLNSAQKSGAQLFFGKAGCANCHSGTNFRGNNDNDVANIGLELNYTDKGMGEFDATKEGVFRVASLRNIALTAPYMHDGRFATLKDVINHYNNGVVAHKNLDQRLTDSWGTGGNPRKLGLTDIEIDNLIEFLKTTTDNNLVSADKFSNPFQN
jgi:cytochrome c peroxidase